MNPEQAEQKEPPKSAPVTDTSVSTSGRRQAFQDLKRQLTEADLANPGTQKLILDMLINAEAERDDLKVFVAQYYEAEKRASILQEKLKGNRLNELLATTGIAMGFAIVGLTPMFWDSTTIRGPICLAVGAILIIVCAVARALYK